MYLQRIIGIVTTANIRTRKMTPRVPAMSFSGCDGETVGREKETLRKERETICTVYVHRIKYINLDNKPIPTTVILLSDYTIACLGNIMFHELLVKDYTLQPYLNRINLQLSS